MNPSTSSRRLLCALGIVLGLCLVGPSGAGEKGKKDSSKGKDDRKMIVIQLDLGKAPPGLVKQLLELAKTTDRDESKSHGKDNDDDKKTKGRKKANVIQVDLNRLSPDLARRLTAELGKSGVADKKSRKKDDDDDDRKKTKSSKKKDD